MLLVKPTRAQLKTLGDLKNNGTWREARKILEAELSAVTERLLDVLDESGMRRLQGRGKFIRDFLEAVDTADEHFKNTKGA